MEIDVHFVKKKSKGENKIKKWLISQNIAFEQDVTFPDCKNSRKLEFDFCIHITDTFFILLEYDGRLHFQPWNSNPLNVKKFERLVVNDKIKNKYCKDRKIKLLRISYKDYNRIKKILSKNLT
jgi:hypothetical protein